ncbi:hypothetical protein DFH06DRAFT_1296249 [Mycena polygramma]|nr:hypothetical protein DFH06DRAFT_1296249 [Mycena polygramma]
MPVASSLKPPAAQPAPAPVAPFLCDGCEQSIPSTSPRVHCLSCPDHDLCAQCALGERFGREHTGAHPTAVYRISGDSVTSPVLSQAWITYATSGTALTHQHSSSANSPGSPIGGTTFNPQPYSPASITAGGTISSVSVGSTTAAAVPDGWSPFFDADMNPTPTFTALMRAIFTHLDPAGTGVLPPEGYSRLLDDMGYPLYENIWKFNLGSPMLAKGREAKGDAAMKAALEAFGIEHTVQARAGQAVQQNPGGSPLRQLQLLQQRADPAPMSMPLLTTRGLTDLVAIELLSDPAGGWEKLGRVVQLYGLDDVEPIGVGAHSRRVQMLKSAGLSAQLQASDNLAAVNAVGGNQYEYRSF